MQGLRPTIHEYLMSIADMCATRATCPRKQVGAVIAKDGRVLSTGYNGSMPHEPHCTDEGCLIIEGHCVRTIHAEVNAIAQAAQNGVSVAGATLYCTLKPCFNCYKTIISAGISQIVYYEEYGSEYPARSRFVHMWRM